jgi:microcystin-dependent protein
MEPFLGEVRMFAGSFAPLGWALCNGQLLSISQNDALFALMGTTYGGDGQVTFALPDFRGRVPVHQGQGPGLPAFIMGQAAGQESVTLTTQAIPSHTHVLGASSAVPAAVPAGGIDLSTTPMVPASPSPKPKMYADPTVLAAMSPQAIAPVGGSQPHNNMAPFLALNFIIALEGIFPSQN